MVIERLLGKRREAIPKALRIFATFMVVNALWVLFRADGVSQTIEIYKGMAAFHNLGLAQLPSVVGQIASINFPTILDLAYIGCLTAVLLFVVFKCQNSAARLNRFTVSKKTLITASVLFSVAFLCLSRESVFIYFNF